MVRDVSSAHMLLFATVASRPSVANQQDATRPTSQWFNDRPLRQHAGGLIAIDHCRHRLHRIVADDYTITDDYSVADDHSITYNDAVTNYDTVREHCSTAKDHAIADDHTRAREDRIADNHAITNHHAIANYDAVCQDGSVAQNDTVPEHFALRVIGLIFRYQ